MKNILPFIIILFLLSSCGKSDTGGPNNIDNEKFSIIDISSDNEKIVAGQRIALTSILNDNKGNVTYEWKHYFNGLEIGSALYGDYPKISINFEDAGEYVVKLTITRGENDKDILEKKFNVIESFFQYGVWGDNQKTIEDAEKDHGNERYTGMIGVPTITDGNKDLTYITYKKGAYYYTYYFKDGALYAGGATNSFNYTNGADMRGAYSLYHSRRNDLGKFLGIELEEHREWRTSDSQIKYYESSSTAMSQAIGYGYLLLYSKGKNDKGTATIDLYKSSATNVLLKYTLVSE